MLAEEKDVTKGKRRDGVDGRDLYNLRAGEIVAAVERSAKAACPDYTPLEDALARWFSEHPGAKALYDRASSARASAAEKSDDQVLIDSLMAKDELTSLKLAAQLEEQLAGPGPDAVYAQQEAEALRTAPAGVTKAAAVCRYYEAHPDEYSRYRAAFTRTTSTRSPLTKARTAYVLKLFDEAIAPVARAMALPIAKARGETYRTVPGLAVALRVAIAKARRGATVAELEAGHADRVRMVKRLAVSALERQVASARAGEAVSFQKAISGLLASDVALRRTVS